MPPNTKGCLSPKSSIGRVDLLVRGVVDGIGLYDTHEAGGAANSRASMAAFMDEVADLIDGAPVRIEMDLVHAYIKV